MQVLSALPVDFESVTQFQAQAYKEMLPAGGPIRTAVVGMESPETLAQATRVKNFMNYYVTEIMEEYDPDMDQMLFYLPLSGSTFKKVYFSIRHVNEPYRSLFQQKIWL